MDTQTLVIIVVIAAAAAVIVAVLRRPASPAADPHLLAALLDKAMAEQRATISTAMSTSLTTLQQANEERLAAADNAIGQQMAAVRQALTDLQAKTGEWSEKRAAETQAITTAATSTKAAVDALHQQTAALSGALSNNQARGQWGEISLRRIVESAGMQEHVDFVAQRQEEGEGTGRPDITVRLPGERVLYIDAKVPWTSYQQYVAAPDDESAAAHLRQHVKDVRGHIDTLAKREYVKAAKALDYVVMYVPVESALSAALQADPDLLTYAAAKSVVLTAPLSLIVMLNNFSKAWDNDTKVRNIDQIVAETDELVTRLVKWVGFVTAVGDGLQKASKAFNSAAGSFNSRVVPQMSRISGLRQRNLDIDEMEQVPADLTDYRDVAFRGPTRDDVVELPVRDAEALGEA